VSLRVPSGRLALFAWARLLITVWKLFLILIVVAGCLRATVHTIRNPATGTRIQWPHEWTPDKGHGVRGDALQAMQAALEHYLHTRVEGRHLGESRCEDSARALDVFYMVDEEQSLVFVQIDEVPQDRCPAREPVTINLPDGGIGTVVARPMPPVILDGISRYAVTLEGRVIDAYVPGGLESPQSLGDGGQPPLHVDPPSSNEVRSKDGE
jgi:hypothetical protein